MPGRAHLDLRTLLAIPRVDPDGGVDLSPDGKEVAFAWNRTRRWEIYRLGLEGNAAALQVSQGSGAKFAPRWSHDGRRLAYVVDLDGGEQYDLWVYDLATGKNINLTPDSAETIQPEYCWSPDDRWIAFVSDREGSFETYVIPSRPQAAPGANPGGAARKVLSLEYPGLSAHWSPDGRWIGVVCTGRGQDQYTYLVSPEGGEAFPIAAAGEPICSKDIAWSPDGAWLAFSSDLHGEFQIGLFDIESRRITWITSGEGDKENPDWSADGRRLAYMARQGAETRLAVQDLKAGRQDIYLVETGIHYRPRFTPDGRHVALVFDNPRNPADLWLLSLERGTFRRLTDSMPPQMRDVPCPMPDQIEYPSFDGKRVPALIFRPDERQDRPPAVLYVHGGPNWLTQITWDPLVQTMVSRGWLVLAPNYRGSTGYGRQWQLANRYDLGGSDTQDVVAGADYLVQHGLADSRRIAITGRSYGGYLTMTSLTQFADRWAGGSAVVPFLNWFTGHANSRLDLQHWDLENFGDPEVDRELYYQRSPFFFLDRVRAPVQLICGANDPRCPASESLQAHEALLKQGKSCDMALYPDEGHSFLKTENVIDAAERRLGFLERVLA